MIACTFQQGDVYFKQHSIHVNALSGSTLCMHFVLTIGEKNNLQGSILKRWVFFKEIKMLKQTKTDSKT